MPTKELALLQQMLENTSFALPSDPQSTCQLKEESREATLKKVFLQELGENALVLFPEKGQGKDKRYSPLLNKKPKSNHNKACDAVILCSHKDKHYQILCELKSGSPKGAAEQFEATLCFLSYLDCLLRRLYQCIPPKRGVRRIVLNTEKQTCQTLDKRPVSPSKRTSPDKEIHFIHVNNDSKIGIGRLIFP